MGFALMQSLWTASACSPPLETEPSFFMQKRLHENDE